MERRKKRIGGHRVRNVAERERERRVAQSRAEREREPTTILRTGRQGSAGEARPTMHRAEGWERIDTGQGFF